MTTSGRSDTIRSGFMTTKKKRDREEIDALTAEINKALDTSIPVRLADELQEGEQRSFVLPSSLNSPQIQELIEKLHDWINDELADHHIIVRNLEQDFYDGQILQKLIEKLAGIRLDYPEVTHSSIGQLQRLRQVIAAINRVLDLPPHVIPPWTAESIHDNDPVSILKLLVALARQFKPIMSFKPGVHVIQTIAKKINGMITCTQNRCDIIDVGRMEPVKPFDGRIYTDLWWTVQRF